jgi:hypothetical protein
MYLELAGMPDKMRAKNAYTKTYSGFDFDLYVHMMSKLSEVSIRYIDSKDTYIDITNKIIYIPMFHKEMSELEFRLRKALVDHEIGHLVFYDDSYSRGHKYKETANFFDDLRIEHKLGLLYKGIGEDLVYLANHLWKQDANGKASLETYTLTGLMVYINTVHRNIRVTGPVHAELKNLFDSEFKRLINDFINSAAPAAAFAGNFMEKAKSFFKENEEPFTQSDGTPDTGTTDERRGSESGSTPKETADTAISALHSVTNFMNVKSLLEHLNAFPEAKPLIHPYFDVEVPVSDLADKIIKSIGMNEYADRMFEAGEWKKRRMLEWRSEIARYRSMFESLLYNVKRERTYKTFNGVLNRKELYRIKTTIADPRIYNYKIKSMIKGYDIVILVDNSGSMGKGGAGMTKIAMAHRMVVVLANALNGIKDIQYEISAYSSGVSYYTDNKINYDYNNVYVIIKDVKNDLAGIDTYLAASPYILDQNFDYGAIKIAYNRLMAMSTDNKKLLIVLSDGTPSSYIETGMEIERLKECVKEIELYVKVVGVGIFDRGVENIYTNHVVIQREEEFTDRVYNAIRMGIIGG